MPFDTFDILWILQEGAFLHSSFWREDFLNISNHLPVKLPVGIGQHHLIKPLIFADKTLDKTLLSGFNWFRTCLVLKVSNSPSSVIDSNLIMPKKVHLITVQEAHKECNSIIDRIWAKYELLDFGECGNFDTPAFKAESSELAHLMAHMSALCRHLNLPMPKDLHRPPHCILPAITLVVLTSPRTF